MLDVKISRMDLIYNYNKEVKIYLKNHIYSSSRFSEMRDKNLIKLVHFIGFLIIKDTQ